MILGATGNNMDSHDATHTFLEVTGGSGNTSEEEVHLLMRSNDGEFSQAWFNVADLLNAIHRANR